MAKKKSDIENYLHGYSEVEQERLYKQAKFLEPYLYNDIDFSSTKNLLEVGSGVGGQTEILLRRFPHLNITGVDMSETQIEAAKKFLAPQIKKGKVQLQVENAEQLSFADGTFDGAYFCWFLEHVPSPVKVLKEVRRTLRSGAIVYANEVQNSSFFLEPYAAATLQYWFAFNDEQWNMGGDPYVGAKLGNFLLEAGYEKIDVRIVPHHFDSRRPKERAQFIEYWTELLLSGAPALLKSGKVEPQLVAEMKKELAAIEKAKDSVFLYTSILARAVVP